MPLLALRFWVSSQAWLGSVSHGHPGEMNMFNLLKPSKMEAFSLPLCHPDTKEDVLQEIADWVMDDKSHQNILWLYGLAGSGKSTIAATISNQLGALNRRGAFLFFKRERADQDPKAVFHTIADQLAKTNPILRAEISDALRLHPNLVNDNIGDQFEKLIQGPLEAASRAMCGPIAIIIDGLDEYGDNGPESRFYPLSLRSLAYSLNVSDSSSQDAQNLISMPRSRAITGSGC